MAGHGSGDGHDCAAFSERLRWEEHAAAHVVALMQPGVWLDPRDEGGRQMHDFDIVHPDGQIDALEVTLATLDELVEAKQAHSKHVGHWMDVDGLRRSWYVFSTSRARFSRWRPGRLADLLRGLEHRAMERFSFGHDARRLPASAAVAHELGIDAASSQAGTGGVLVLPPNDDSVWVSDHMNPGKHAIRELERTAEAADNRRKLESSGRSERHLFVWIDETNYLPWSDLHRGQIPRRPPELGSSITMGWLATIGATSVVCWTYRPSEGWQEQRFEITAVTDGLIR
jgi:hypothetical protein